MLNSKSRAQKANLEFASLKTPASLFSPDYQFSANCVLLDHQWDGFTVSTIVGRIFEIAPKTVVIVYTFKPVNTSQLVECVRLGVADYWSKDQVEGEAIIPNLLKLSMGSIYTLQNQRTMAGIAPKLVEELDKLKTDNGTLHGEIMELRSDLLKYKSTERRALMGNLGKALQAVLCVLFLVLVFIYAKSSDSLKLNFMEAIGLMSTLGIVLLFVLEKIQFIGFSFGKSKGGIRG